MTASLLGIALSLMILAVGVFLGQKLASTLQVEDCSISAAPRCVPIAAWEKHPVERRGGWHDLTSASRR